MDGLLKGWFYGRSTGISSAFLAEKERKRENENYTY